jgi:hypothetical protein
MPRNRAARNTLCRHPEAERDIAIKRAESQRAAAVAKAQADQERVAAETASLPKQAEANRDLDEAKAKRDLFLARHRRGVALGKAARAQSAFGDHSQKAPPSIVFRTASTKPRPSPAPKSNYSTKMPATA